MHILFLTDNFPPEVNAPASRTFEHAQAWVQSGHKVTIVTSVPNFPHGKVFPGYKNKLIQREVVHGIDVIRVWTFLSPNKGVLKRLVDQISYLPTSIIASIFVRKVDVIVGTSPNFFAALAAYIIAVVKRRPWVFELRDIWPASIQALGAMSDSWILKAFEKVELFLYKRSSAIVAVTKSFKTDLVRRQIETSKISVVTNGADLSRFSPRPKNSKLQKKLNLEGKFVLGYIGTHGAAHALETLIDAALIAQTQSTYDSFHFLFVGEGAEKSKLKALASKHDLKNITFLDAVSKDLVPEYWSLLDASIIHLKRIPLFKTVIPSKSFESMAMGIPILLGVEGEIAQLVQENSVGLLFEPENSRALLDVAQRLRNNDELRVSFCRHGIEASGKYDRTQLAKNMLTILEQLEAEHS